MTWTATTFRAEYTEYANVPDAIVSAKLAAAATRCHADFGDDLDAAVGLLTAHLLSLGPYGQQVEGKDAGQSKYWGEWSRLARARFGGPRINET